MSRIADALPFRPDGTTAMWTQITGVYHKSMFELFIAAVSDLLRGLDLSPVKSFKSLPQSPNFQKCFEYIPRESDGWYRISSAFLSLWYHQDQWVVVSTRRPHCWQKIGRSKRLHYRGFSLPYLVLFLQLVEPLTSNAMYPFAPQVWSLLCYM